MFRDGEMCMRNLLDRETSDVNRENRPHSRLTIHEKKLNRITERAKSATQQKFNSSNVADLITRSFISTLE
jgi:hypothetical protein